MVAAPPAVGVNVAVYEVPLPEKSLKTPLVTVTSPSTKSVVGSLDVNVSDSVASFDASPLFTPAAVIVIPGAVVSAGVTVTVRVTSVAAFPAASLTLYATVKLPTVSVSTVPFVKFTFFTPLPCRYIVPIKYFGVLKLIVVSVGAHNNTSSL